MEVQVPELIIKSNLLWDHPLKTMEYASNYSDGGGVIYLYNIRLCIVRWYIESDHDMTSIFISVGQTP